MEKENILQKTSRIKNNSVKVLMDLDFIQALFTALDTDKYLLLKSTNPEQENQIRQRENAFQTILEKLYVPLPIENV